MAIKYIIFTLCIILWLAPEIPIYIAAYIDKKNKDKKDKKKKKEKRCLMCSLCSKKKKEKDKDKL